MEAAGVVDSMRAASAVDWSRSTELPAARSVARTESENFECKEWLSSSTAFLKEIYKSAYQIGTFSEQVCSSVLLVPTFRFG